MIVSIDNQESIRHLPGWDSVDRMISELADIVILDLEPTVVIKGDWYLAALGYKDDKNIGTPTGDETKDIGMSVLVKTYEACKGVVEQYRYTLADEELRFTLSAIALNIKREHVKAQDILISADQALARHSSIGEVAQFELLELV